MKTKRNNLKKFFKLRILFFGILVALWGCEKEEIPIQNEQKNTNNGDGVAKIENISFNQLPKEFIDNYIDYQNKTGTTILSKNNNKEALKREFKEKITKVTAENGVITYNVIPLKKENSNSLRKSNECEDPDPDHSVISMNIGADGTRSDLYQTDFYGIGTPFLNNNNSPNSRFNFFVNVVNLGFGGSLVNNNPSNSNITKCKKRRKGSGGGGLNINFRSFWDWIKGIFRSRGKVMHGGCPTTGIDQEQPGGGFSNMARFDDDLLYDFKIPLEASDFASKTRKTPTIEDFDCACEKDKSFTIAQFLELEFEETLFLADDNQRQLRKKICAFVKDNNHSDKAKIFAKEVIVALFTNNWMTINDIDFEDRIINKLTGKIKCIHNKLNKGNNLYKQLLDNFNDSNTNILKLNIGSTSNGDWGITKGDIDNTREFSITISNNIENSSNLSKIVTLSHELIHAYMFDTLEDWGYLTYDTNNNPLLNITCQNGTNYNNINLNNLSDEERFVALICAMNQNGTLTVQWTHELFNSSTFNTQIYRQELESLILNEHDWGTESIVLKTLLQGEFGNLWKKKTAEYLSWRGLEKTQDFENWLIDSNIDYTKDSNGNIICPYFNSINSSVRQFGKNECN